MSDIGNVLRELKDEVSIINDQIPEITKNIIDICGQMNYNKFYLDGFKFEFEELWFFKYPEILFTLSYKNKKRKINLIETILNKNYKINGEIKFNMNECEYIKLFIVQIKEKLNEMPKGEI